MDGVAKVNLTFNRIRLVMIEFNEKKYARVSEVLSCFSDFSHIDPKVLANKQRIGTSVHKAIEDDIGGGFPTPDNDAYGYYESYEKWKMTAFPRFIKSEERYFCHEKLLTGQIDALIHYGYAFQVPVMIDFKTSAQEDKVTWPMQAHLYAYLLAVNGISVQPRYLFIKLNKKGGLPDVYEYAWSQNTHIKCMDAIDDFWKKNHNLIAKDNQFQVD